MSAKCSVDPQTGSTATSKPRVLLISSVRPQKTSGSSIVLYRHLIERQDCEVMMVGHAEMLELENHPIPSGWVPIVRRNPISGYIRNVLRYRKPNSRVLKQAKSFQPDVILTVADGPLFWLAKGVSKSCSVPLVTFFHDWWPTMIRERQGVSRITQMILESRFRRQYRSSDCALPVCDGMREALGPHPNARTLLPIPPSIRRGLSEAETEGNVIYMGNMTEGYGQMIRRLLQSAGDFCQFVRCFGDSSDWDHVERDEYVRRGVLADRYVPDSELVPKLFAAEALIVTLPMNHSEIYQQTSFPSKLFHYLQYGRPIVYWGSARSSIVRWASQHQAIAVFTDPDPGELVRFLRRLHDDTSLQQEMRQETLRLSRLINPEEIHSQFLGAIRNVTLQSP